MGNGEGRHDNLFIMGLNSRGNPPLKFSFEYSSPGFICLTDQHRHLSIIKRANLVYNHVGRDTWVKYNVCCHDTRLESLISDRM
jgi:hypothetical protein